MKPCNSKTIPWLIGAIDFNPGLYKGRANTNFYSSKFAYYFLALNRAQRYLTHTQLIKLSWSFDFLFTVIQNYGSFQTILLFNTSWVIGVWYLLMVSLNRLLFPFRPLSRRPCEERKLNEMIMFSTIKCFISPISTKFTIESNWLSQISFPSSGVLGVSFLAQIVRRIRCSSFIAQCF